LIKQWRSYAQNKIRIVSMNDVKIIFKDIGSLLIIVGCVILLACVVPIVFQEEEGIKYLGLTGGLFLGIGIPLRVICQNKKELNFKHAMSIAALGWLFISLIGSVPFLFLSEGSEEGMVVMGDARDGFLVGANISYDDARTASLCQVVDTGGDYLVVGQVYDPSENLYKIYRSYVIFDTSPLPQEATIVSAVLKLWGSQDRSLRDFTICVQGDRGGGYPHVPLEEADYFYLRYDEVMGDSFNTSNMQLSGYNNISFSGNETIWISTEGLTRLCLRSSHDCDGSIPQGDERVFFNSTNQGGYPPVLSLTYYAPGQGMSPLSAVFESTAGWTGTGLTMVQNETELPKTLQFYRSLTQWIGGIGVIVLTLTILARPGTGSFTLYRSEGREQKIRPSIISTVRTIWWIFLLYTILGVILLFIVGIFVSEPVGLWEALNHCMTGLSTGGFSVTDGSVAHYGVVMRLAIIFLMVMGAIAFAAHFDLLTGKIRKFLSDVQTRALILLIFMGGVVLTLVNVGVYDNNFLLSLKESMFQFISALTCTGFATTDLSAWTNTGLLVMSSAMILGGAAGSTAGGIKLFRGILLGKGTAWRTKRIFYPPRAVFNYTLGGKSISREEALDEVNEAAVISFMWIILLFFGVLVVTLSVPGEQIGNVIFEVCSAQGNVGLSTGITQLHMPFVAKFMLILNMWIGRLEIIPILVLIRAVLRRKKLF